MEVIFNRSLRLYDSAQNAKIGRILCADSARIFVVSLGEGGKSNLGVCRLKVSWEMTNGNCNFLNHHTALEQGESSIHLTRIFNRYGQNQARWWSKRRSGLCFEPLLWLRGEKFSSSFIVFSREENFQRDLPPPCTIGPPPPPISLPRSHISQFFSDVAAAAVSII